MATRKKKGSEKTTRLAETTAKAAVARSEGLVALVVRRKVDIAEAFYDIGLAPCVSDPIACDNPQARAPDHPAAMCSIRRSSSRR